MTNLGMIVSLLSILMTVSFICFIVLGFQCFYLVSLGNVWEMSGNAWERPEVPLGTLAIKTMVSEHIINLLGRAKTNTLIGQNQYIPN